MILFSILLPFFVIHLPGMFCSLIFLWLALDLSLGSWPFAHNVKRRFTEASPGLLTRPKVWTLHKADSALLDRLWSKSFLHSAISEYIILAGANSELKFYLQHFQNVWESWPAAYGCNVQTLTQELSAFCNWQGKDTRVKPRLDEKALTQAYCLLAASIYPTLTVWLSVVTWKY